MKVRVRIAAVVFAIIALGHLIRIILRLDFVVGGVVIPYWPSVVAFLVFAVLSILLWTANGSRGAGGIG